MKNTITTKKIILPNGNVFKDGKFVGYVDKVENWGAPFLARCIKKENRFFANRKSAFLYMTD
jgi:hypothetical protein